MAARSGYTALTPETTTTFPPRYAPAHVLDGSEAIQPWHTTTNFGFPASFARSDVLRRYWNELRGFVDNNAGLLLVALAQLFFAFVNVSIKVLKEADENLTTFQVRIQSTWKSRLN